MKTLCMLLVGSFLATAAFSQSITISFNGNKDFRALVDGRSYSSNDYNSGMNDQVVLNNLTAGDHTVQVYKVNRKGREKQIYSSTFRLNVNEDVRLTVNSNGSVSREESSSNPAYGPSYGYRTPVSDIMFNNVYQTVTNKRGQSARMSAARVAFTTYNNYFTVDQAKKIIQLINSEANRLELTKLAYDHLVDPASYWQLYDLLGRQESRNELDMYAKNRNVDPNYNPNGTGNYAEQAMSDQTFNNLYDNISSKWFWFSKMNAARDAFQLASNHFTTSQAGKIIALINGENDRLELAKLSYDNIVDKQNFRDIYSLLDNQSSRDELDNYIQVNYNNLY